MEPGYTLQLPIDDLFLTMRAELWDRIRGALGGRAAEQLVSREITTETENDLERAAVTARQMICMYGKGKRRNNKECSFAKKWIALKWRRN